MLRVYTILQLISRLPVRANPLKYGMNFDINEFRILEAFIIFNKSQNF